MQMKEQLRDYAQQALHRAQHKLLAQVLKNVSPAGANGAVEAELLKGERLTLKVRLSDIDFARFQARSFT